MEALTSSQMFPAFMLLAMTLFLEWSDCVVTLVYCTQFNSSVCFYTYEVHEHNELCRISIGAVCNTNDPVVLEPIPQDYSSSEEAMSTIKRKPSLKIIILGDSRWGDTKEVLSRSVGKSCIIQQYIFQKFSDKYKSTIGSDFFTHDTVINDVPYSLQVWIHSRAVTCRSGILPVRSVSRAWAPPSTEVRTDASWRLISRMPK